MLSETKGKIEINEGQTYEDRSNLPDGIYMVDFISKNDRIVLILMKKIIAIIEIQQGEILLQISSTGNPNIYNNYRLIKNFDLKVTL